MKKPEIFEVGPCEDGYEMGFLIGQRFSKQIKSRLTKDLILQNQLLPFARSPHSQSLLKSLSETNMKKYPKYWDELRGTAQGSGAPFLEITLLNFRKEILPFILGKKYVDDTNDDCSDILVVSESMAVAAHNEDANVALVGHTYLIKGILPNGVCFTAYTYAGELPSCAFGFNNYGLAFTLNSVPPCGHEIAAGAIGRNFISRDLLESQSIDNALARIYTSEASVGHSYNLIDVKTRRILNVETASRNRYSVYEVGAMPFFHANMYLHLEVQQAGCMYRTKSSRDNYLNIRFSPAKLIARGVICNFKISVFVIKSNIKVVEEHDENSLSREKRAAMLPMGSRSDFLSLLGDKNDTKYPIYMTGPLLYTLCTVVIDLDEKTFSIIEGDPKEPETSFAFSML